MGFKLTPCIQRGILSRAKKNMGAHLDFELIRGTVVQLEIHIPLSISTVTVSKATLLVADLSNIGIRLDRMDRVIEKIHGKGVVASALEGRKLEDQVEEGWHNP